VAGSGPAPFPATSAVVVCGGGGGCGCGGGEGDGPPELDESGVKGLTGPGAAWAGVPGAGRGQCGASPMKALRQGDAPRQLRSGAQPWREDGDGKRVRDAGIVTRLLLAC
jgi:hypothetical protein